MTPYFFTKDQFDAATATAVQHCEVSLRRLPGRVLRYRARHS